MINLREFFFLVHPLYLVDAKLFSGTSVCAGNYYSLRAQHEKAVLYFQRALKLNPGYLSAWTLMGHEYMELKQTSAAIQAYRQAIGPFILLTTTTAHSVGFCYNWPILSVVTMV